MDKTYYQAIGEKIKIIRESINLTQDDLAQRLGLTRPAISNIEKGERKLSAEETFEISKILNINPGTLLNPETKAEIDITLEEGTQEPQESIRISVPQKNLQKFKEVLLYILGEVGSKPNIGETVLYKLLYFIDFNYYEKYEEQLIGATYIKNHHGPTPVEFVKIVDRMIKDEELTTVQSKYFQYPQQKYLPIRDADLSKLTGSELEMINEVLDHLSDMNATQISDYSHEDVPWMVSEDQETIDYESVFYRTAPYSVR
jgi:transcriptional regulator with XRE-family HTH domain